MLWIKIGKARRPESARGLAEKTRLLLAGFSNHQVHGQFQVYNAACDVGIAGRAVRVAVAFVVHGPDFVAPANEVVHHGVVVSTFDLQVKHGFGGIRRAVNQK